MAPLCQEDTAPSHVIIPPCSLLTHSGEKSLKYLLYISSKLLYTVILHLNMAAVAGAPPQSERLFGYVWRMLVQAISHATPM